jgi:rfaE bifunctional protein kinase chain/domain
MLTHDRLELILKQIPALTIGVLGDLFLDRYLDLDAALTEPSLETGLDAYQVTAVRASPGAAGTVINNLAAFGVGRIVPIAVIGEDGEGFELLRSLERLANVDRRWLIQDSRRRTPTYMKPMLHHPGQRLRELNRFDIKNRMPLAPDLEQQLFANLSKAWASLNALIVVDQVSEVDCGVVTVGMQMLLQQLGQTEPTKFILADSRDRIGQFRAVCVKPNQSECRHALSGERADIGDIETAARLLGGRTGRAVFCTRGEHGILLVQPGTGNDQVCDIPAYRITGPIDIVGAGDSTSAAIAAAVAGGASYVEAAAFGNLVASITIQQLGTTGSASPEQIRRRWQEVT